MARGSRNGASAEAQLTLEIASSLNEELPISGTLRVAGAMRVERDLNRDQVVKVAVVDPLTGDVLAEALASVEGVALITKRTETGAYVERRHSSKLASA